MMRLFLVPILLFTFIWPLVIGVRLAEITVGILVCPFDVLVGVTFALDCIYYNSLETSTFQLILTAEDTEGASGQASVTFESYCKPLD